jgi:hypothetical protein
MSEKYLPEIIYEEQLGFKSALFLNMSDYYPNCTTPKKTNDIRDSCESVRLSIESLTPGTTPKGAEKRKNDSQFRFCLSNDLLMRLEESSPFNVYAERKGTMGSDVFLGEIEEEEGNDSGDKDTTEEDMQMRSIIGEKRKYFNKFTPSTLPSGGSEIEDGKVFNGEEFSKKLNFGKCEEKNEKESQRKEINVGKNIRSSSQYPINNTFNAPINTINTYSSNLGVFNSYGKNTTNTNTNINSSSTLNNVNNLYNSNQGQGQSLGNNNNNNNLMNNPFNFMKSQQQINTNNYQNNLSNLSAISTINTYGKFNSGNTINLQSNLNNMNCMNNMNNLQNMYYNQTLQGMNSLNIDCQNNMGNMSMNNNGISMEMNGGMNNNGISFDMNGGMNNNGISFDMNGGMNPGINMYGKSGWICVYCKNFNYESK